jgi:hypothetical protein
MKRKELWVGTIVVVVILVLAFFIDARIKQGIVPTASQNESGLAVDERVQADSGTNLNIANETYSIGNTKITLKDGVASTQIEGSTGVRKTVLLEGPAFADVNGDGQKDAVLLIKDESGGSGTFYYVAAVLTKSTTELATNSILLGDRIRIKEISVDNGIIYVTILDKEPTEAMSTKPTIEKILKFKIVGEKLVQAL